MLPYAKTEIEQLRDVCNRLIKRAETQPQQWQDTRSEIGTVFDILSEGLPKVAQDREKGQDVPNEGEELADEEEELSRRRAALIGVLRKPGLIDVLEYLDDRGKTDLPKKKVGGEYLKAIATRYLVNDLALAEKDDTWPNHVEYELTQRGEVVTAAWKHLRDAPSVEKESEAADTTKREAAHHLFSTLWPNTVDSTDVLAHSDK
jgi:hypothetical protein